MYLAPDGNSKYQAKYMDKKATDWETLIRSGGVQYNEAWKSLNSIYPQNIKYSLSPMEVNE